jgi:streptogramin lyase
VATAKLLRDSFQVAELEVQDVGGEMSNRLAVVSLVALLFACNSSSANQDGGTTDAGGSGDGGATEDGGGNGDAVANGDAGGSGGDAGTPTFQTFTMGCCDFATLAIDSAGRVWAASDFIQPSGNVQIYRFDPGTKTSTGFEISGTSGAQVVSGGISIDATGNVWIVTTPQPGVSSATGVALLQVSPTGSVLTRIHDIDTNPGLSCYQNPCPNYPFSNPGTAMVDRAGNIWVKDIYTGVPGFFLTQLTPTGTLGMYANVATGFGASVASIEIDGAGNLWTIDEGNNMLVKMAPGSAAQTFALPASVNLAGLHLAFDKQGTPWIAVGGGASTAGSLLKMTTSGTVAATYAIPNAGTADGVVVDNANMLWVVDNNDLKLRAVSTSGTFVAEYTMPRGANGGTGAPTPLGIDAAGNVWYGGTDITNGTGALNELAGVATGPQYFPYMGPQYPY